MRGIGGPRAQALDLDGVLGAELLVLAVVELTEAAALKVVTTEGEAARPAIPRIVSEGPGAQGEQVR